MNGPASDSVLRHPGEWFSTSVTSGPDAIPEDLVGVVSDGHAGHLPRSPCGVVVTA